jgi:hypothetical protein
MAYDRAGPQWTVLSRMKVYTYMTLITTLVFLNMCGGVVLLPVFFISPGAYRKITTFMLWFSEPGFLCIPFSWAACKVRCNGLGYLIRYVGKDALFISNHSARVDWYLGMFLTTMYCQRVAFVMEYFAMMMPIVGWWRYLVEDMYVVRSFKQDQERLDQNIDGFHTSGVHRWLYLSPEGMIADFSEHDKKYIRDCRRFCEDMSVDPYDYLLTPRYKGMTCFNRLVTEGVSEEDTTQVVSVTMAYCKDGKNLCKPLIDDDRHIPDLFDLLGGGMTVDVHLHMLSLSNNPEVLKGQMMEEYALKDKLLKHFHEHGFFPVCAPGPKPPSRGLGLEGRSSIGVGWGSAVASHRISVVSPHPHECELGRPGCDHLYSRLQHEQRLVPTFLPSLYLVHPWAWTHLECAPNGRPIA